MSEGPRTSHSVKPTGPSTGTDGRSPVLPKQGAGRLLRLGSLVALVVAALMLAPVGGGAATPRPDLVVSSLSAKGSLVSGRSVTATITTRNAGQRRAAASRTRLHLSRDRSLSSLDKLLGSVSVPALDPGQSVSRTLTITVPATSPPAGELLACADGGRAIPEASETNNCRALPDGDRDGWANFTDCAPANAVINPGAADQPDVPAFRDINCDGIDGSVRRAIFVSPVGDDANAGTRSAPKETLRAALDTAAAQGKDVYATQGNNYRERLVMRNGVGLYGGYDTAWRRSLTNRTQVTGAVVGSWAEGAVATDITTPTSLQHVTLIAPSPGGAGGSSYGLRAIRSGGLRLERVVASAAAGRGGTPGGDGAAGQPGGNGGVSFTAARGITSWGRNGGQGGRVGCWECGQDAGYPGEQGFLQAPGENGLVGGPGGAGGPDSGNGVKGEIGDSGVKGRDGNGGSGGSALGGLWRSSSGQAGADGTHGHGGGGGGGGGAIGVFEDPGGTGGGGGGGGQGGRGGGAGTGGGGSFGLFLVDSSGAVVKDSTLTASTGGPAAGGGSGGFGGGRGTGATGSTKESTFDESKGGDGGLGGHGGIAGGGGGGAGGPSIALFASNTALTDSGNALTHGTGGAGGSGGGGTGASGQAADRN